jgi:hypothetical protein
MGRTMKRAAAAGAAAVLVLGLAACGDDDDAADTTDETTEDAAGGDLAAFCDALVEFNGAVMEVDIDEDSSEEDVVTAGEQLAPLFDTIADNAPDSVGELARELNDETMQPLLDGDAEAFNSDATFEDYTEMLSGGVGECDFETVAVTGIDFGYEGVPATIAAGTTSFQFTNASEVEEHEMLLLKKAEGTTQTFAEIAALPEEESESLIEFKGAAFAPPGGQSGTLAELDPGDYAMICFIPVGGAEDGAPHFTQGMLTEFTVE